MGSSIIVLALALEELEHDDTRNPRDCKAREREQTDEEQFEGDELIHGFSLRVSAH